MVIVYATMVADLFHRGHIEFLKKAKSLGDYLIIGLHPDKVVETYKRKPIFSYIDRREILLATEAVDRVVEDNMEFFEPTMLQNVVKYKVDIAVHGNEWLPSAYAYLRDNKICSVVQVPYYPGISTTQIIQKIIETEKQLK